MSESDVQYVLAVLSQWETTGTLGGAEMEYWTGGGQPPPYYRSDQFRLHTVDGIEILEFAKVKYDSRYEPSNLLEKFRLPAQPSDVKTIARLLRDTGVFTSRYPEEDNPGIADVLSTEVIVTAGGCEYKKVYYRVVPSQLAPLRAEVERVIQRLKASGSRELLHQGKRIE